MFSSSNSHKLVVASMMMMMMLVMTIMSEAAAVPIAGCQSKHSGKNHSVSSSGTAVEMVPLELDPKLLVPAENIRILQNVSISPWTYNISHDADLVYPVSEARCLLRGCVGSEDLSLESRPILHQVLLLRRVQSAGAGSSYHFRLESRLVAVGCTCVRPPIQHQH